MASHEMVEKAEALARVKHKDHTYGEGRSYADAHLAAVVKLVSHMAEGPERALAEAVGLYVLLAAAWLHDVIEDTDYTPEDMTRDFGALPTVLVVAVTNGPGRNRKERQASTYPKIRAVPGAKLLKLCDRLVNFENCLANNHGLLSMYVREYPQFRQELYKEGELVELWLRLDGAYERGDAVLAAASK